MEWPPQSRYVTRTFLTTLQVMKWLDMSNIMTSHVADTWTHDRYIIDVFLQNCSTTKWYCNASVHKDLAVHTIHLYLGKEMPELKLGWVTYWSACMHAVLLYTTAERKVLWQVFQTMMGMLKNEPTPCEDKYPLSEFLSSDVSHNFLVRSLRGPDGYIGHWG